MALNIKNKEVEKLVEEVAKLAGETKTDAVRQALLERKQRLSFRVVDRGRGRSFLHYLETEVWPRVPKAELGRKLTKKEREQILGYGRDGV
jgi:antitoxin VapB